MWQASMSWRFSKFPYDLTCIVRCPAWGGGYSPKFPHHESSLILWKYLLDSLNQIIFERFHCSSDALTPVKYKIWYLQDKHCLDDLILNKTITTRGNWLSDTPSLGKCLYYRPICPLLGGAFLHMLSSINDFSRSCISVDGKSIVTNLHHTLCSKLNDGSASMMQSHHIVSNTKYAKG